MQQPEYTAKEVLDIHLRSILDRLDRFDVIFSKELNEVTTLIKEQNVVIKERAQSTDARFEKIDIDMQKLRIVIQEMKEENAGYKKIWGIGGTIGASFVGLISAFIFNKIF